MEIEMRNSQVEEVFEGMGLYESPKERGYARTEPWGSSTFR